MCFRFGGISDQYNSMSAGVGSNPVTLKHVKLIIYFTINLSRLENIHLR